VWGEQVSTYEPLPDGNKHSLIKLAKEQEQQFVRRGIRYNDPEFQEIVDRVAASVLPSVADTFIDYRVYLIRDPSPRAFSLADGQIYVHTGLLARLESEAQLAAVLAHEAHHVAVHHHIQANDKRRSSAQIAGSISMMLNSNSADDVSYGNEMEHITQSVFSEEMEFDADAGSVTLIARAGYAPVAAPQALARLRQDPELTMEHRAASFNGLASLTERQGRLQVMTEGMMQNDSTVADSGPRPLQLRRVIEMTIDDYIRLDRPGTAVELIDSMLAEQPDAFLYAAKGDSHLALGPRPVNELQTFGYWVVDGKRAVKTRDEMAEKYLAMEGGPERLAYNLDSAVEAYEMAIQLDDSSVRAYRGLGNMYYEQNEYRQAGRNYVKYLKLAPEALDRPFVLENLQHIKAQLIKNKETEQ